MIVAGALTLLTIAGWASGRLPEHVVALAFFVLAVLFRVAPASVVFSGFTSSALWLIFGGQIMGIAIRHTGLARRIAEESARYIGTRSYPAVIAGVVTLGVLLSFFMPSAMGRVMLLMPIAVALADQYGFVEVGGGRNGVLLAAAFGTTVPAFAILPANVPNAVLLGAADAHGIAIGYLEYLALHFPVLGIVRAIAIVLILVALYPARLPTKRFEPGPRAPLSRDERKVALLVTIALLLWATDSLHGVQPAWVSLAVGVVLLTLGSGVLPPRAFNEQVGYASLFFVAGVLGVGAVLTHTGTATALGRTVSSLLPLSPHRHGLNFASLATLGAALGLLTTAPGLPAVMTSLVGPLAEATGLPLRTVLMSEALGYSNILLPYQSPPLVVASQLAQVPSRATAGACVALFVVTSALLLPLDYLWWRLLGWS